MMTPDLMRRALWGVVANRAQKVRRRKNSRSLWWHVHRVTALGATLSQRLCEEFGFYPETGEQVRGWGELWQPSDTRARLVIVESPYAGDVERNLRYLRAALRDCVLRGESPYASHGLLTQPGVLDDLDPEERRLGISLGCEWRAPADATIFYTDLGWSSGMRQALLHAEVVGRPVEYRELPGWSP